MPDRLGDDGLEDEEHSSTEEHLGSRYSREVEDQLVEAVYRNRAVARVLYFSLLTFRRCDRRGINKSVSGPLFGVLSWGCLASFELGVTRGRTKGADDDFSPFDHNDGLARKQETPSYRALFRVTASPSWSLRRSRLVSRPRCSRCCWCSSSRDHHSASLSGIVSSQQVPGIT